MTEKPTETTPERPNTVPAPEPAAEKPPAETRESAAQREAREAEEAEAERQAQQPGKTPGELSRELNA